MRMIMTLLCTITCFLITNGQTESEKFALLRYEAAVSLDVFTDLDKRKLTRSKEKSLHSKIMGEQFGRYRTQTFPFFWDLLAQKQEIEIAEASALEGRVNYEEGVPIPLFPKRMLVKKCKDMPYEYFLITNVEVVKPVIKLASNLLTIKTTIKVLDKNGDVVQQLKNDMKLEKPIRSRDFEGGFDKIYRAHYDQLYEILAPNIEKALTQAFAEFQFPT